MNRLLVLVTAIATLVVAFAAPASAVKPVEEEGHKITICHVTNSATNPYVEIEIDLAAWNDPTDPKHHGDHHTSDKTGLTDKVLTGDSCTDDPPIAGSCAGVDVDVLVDIPEDAIKLWAPVDGAAAGHQHDTIGGLSIPPGSYTVVLGSWDPDHPGGPNQDNEQWRANFGGGVVSGSAADLDTDEGGSYSTAVDTMAGPVVLTSTVTLIVADHWSTYDGNQSLSPDSVYPRCVGLNWTGPAN